MLVIVAFVALINIISLVSSQPLISENSALGFSFTNFGDAGRNAIATAVDFVQPVFEVIIGEYSGTDFFFAKCMILILLFIVLYFATQKVPIFEGQKSIAFIVAAVISILAIRFISENDLTNMILLPYGVAGVAMVTILPFMIFVYFTHATNMGGMARRLSWMVFAVIFGVLWLNRAPQLNDITKQIYMWTFVAIVIMFIFDSAIHKYFALHELSNFFTRANEKSIAQLQKEYLDIASVESKEAESRRKYIAKQLKELGGKVP